MFARTVRCSIAAHPSVASKQLVAHRQLSTSSRQLARKDTMDKDSLQREPNEYSKSGSDDQAAALEDTAFDPSKTSPEEQHDSAGSESDGGNPLNVSPANPEVSKEKGAKGGDGGSSPAESGQGNSDRARTSGGGSPSKNGGGKSGGGGA
ncbi:hypothetical protein LTR08_008844 [Meristemomyces frigidus]|nr:hypothetical protein LTR08_008844 [Meristemomyces frigidus]